MMRLTPVQEQLLSAIRHRGQVRSLLALTIDLCIDYRTARRYLYKLERHRLVTVQRQPGYPLVIEATSQNGDSVLCGSQIANNKSGGGHG